MSLPPFPSGPDRNRLEAALASAEARLAVDPADFDAHFLLAQALRELGRPEEAKTAYLALLGLVPDHFGALNNLGALLHETGYRTGALTCFSRAVACHPDRLLGRVNFGDALFKAGRHTEAKEQYEAALRLDPASRAAHRGLSFVHWELGGAQAAAEHRAKGFEGAATVALPHRGAGTPLRAVLLVSAMGGNTPLAPFFDDATWQVTLVYADFVDAGVPLPPADLVVNAVGDADLCGLALERAEVLTAGVPVLNPPRAVAATGRIPNALRLGVLADVRTPAMVDLPRAALEAADAAAVLSGRGFSFPLLLRTPGFHNGQHFSLVRDPGGLRTAVDALPGEVITAMDYLDARDPDGWIRKYRVMIVDGVLHPLHAAVASDWNVHFNTAGMEDAPERLAEDRAFLADMAGVLGPRAMAALERIKGALALDYAGIDFSLDAQGGVLLFEANATMVIPVPDPGAVWDYRRGSVESVMKAVRALLRERCKAQAGPAAGAPFRKP